MDKAVQVGLVFSRSGQQVLVNIPLASVERFGVQHLDPKGPPVLSTLRNHSTVQSEKTTHAR